MQRPEFSEIKSYEDFSKFYWYRTELEKICRQLGIDHSGTKQELNHTIKEYFNGHIIKKKKSDTNIANINKVNLDTSLLKCGFSFNGNFRKYFSKQTGVKNFKFTADMATAWRKVKKEKDIHFTIQDMLNVYHNKSNYAKYDNSACEWNQFVKDFCADNKNIVFHNKLKVASILWRKLKESSKLKIYSYELVKENWELLQNYR